MQTRFKFFVLFQFNISLKALNKKVNTHTTTLSYYISTYNPKKTLCIFLKELLTLINLIIQSVLCRIFIK